jgi:hypothetical protein
MNISRDDASLALDAVLAADQRVREFKGAREASPHLIFWGLAWFFANGVTGLAPQHAGKAWLAVLVIGAVFTTWIVVRQSRQRQAGHSYTAQERAAIGRRATILGTTVLAFFPAMLAVLAPLSAMQNNAFISLFWAFAYIASGAWFGTRMVVAGIVTAVATLVGFFLLPGHYFLWMALVGGGSLLLAGLWLRKL